MVVGGGGPQDSVVIVWSRKAAQVWHKKSDNQSTRKTMADETTDGPPSYTDNAESWLEQLGLQASSMDPSSLEALADVLSGQRVDFFESPRGQDLQDDRTVATAAAAVSSSPNQNTNEVRGEAMAISSETRDMILAVLGVDQQQDH
jgi:hypothetical protein